MHLKSEYFARCIPVIPASTLCHTVLKRISREKEKRNTRGTRISMQSNPRPVSPHPCIQPPSSTHRHSDMHACIKYKMHMLSSAGAIDYWFCICTQMHVLWIGRFLFIRPICIVHTDQLRTGMYLVFPPSPEALMYLHDAELGGGFFY